VSATKALMAFEELLRRFQNQLNNAPGGVEATFEAAFGFLMTRLRLENVALFWWDPQRHTLSMQCSLNEGGLMEGEEEVIVDAGSPLRLLVEEKRPVVVANKRPWVAYIPLQNGSEFAGAIRLQRHHPLPQGRVMKTLPPMSAPINGRERRYPLLEDLSALVSVRLHQLTRDEKHRKRMQYLQAGSEVASAVFERPRLRDMLEAVSRSIIQNLGFDRIRIFLDDVQGTRLEGILGLQIPNMLLDLTGENYPLTPGHNSLVDAVLSAGKESQIHLVGGRVVYVPLVVNGQVIGCLAADNLLSQQLMDEEQMEALRVLAGQIGMAVLNARLFEDIEQQAITDGLTKLYVHRYFQQRLKEEIDRADRYAYNVALIMMDMDHFKALNDTHGHLTGDRALEYVSQIIRSNIRRIDLAARYGGDEVVLVLPEITEQEAWLMCERLINAVKKGTLTTVSGVTVPVSMSLGAALYPADGQNSRDLLDAADKALYWAKKHNRGSVCFYRTLAPQPGSAEKSA
jgi:diguanylate cyclase (GGDEF)-like protein